MFDSEDNEALVPALGVLLHGEGPEHADEVRAGGAAHVPRRGAAAARARRHRAALLLLLPPGGEVQGGEVAARHQGVAGRVREVEGSLGHAAQAAARLAHQRGQGRAADGLQLPGAEPQQRIRGLVPEPIALKYLTSI